MKNGDVACFGEMGYGEQFLDAEKPKKIAGLHGATGLRSGTHVTCGLRGGKVLCHGRPQEVLQNAEAKKYYFGDSMDLGGSLENESRRKEEAA